MAVKETVPKPSAVKKSALGDDAPVKLKAVELPSAKVKEFGVVGCTLALYTFHAIVGDADDATELDDKLDASELNEELASLDEIEELGADEVGKLTLLDAFELVDELDEELAPATGRTKLLSATHAGTLPV